MAEMSALPATQPNYTYEFTAHPEKKEPRRIRVSIFIECSEQGHPTRLVGISRRLDWTRRIPAARFGRRGGRPRSSCRPHTNPSALRFSSIP